MAFSRSSSLSNKCHATRSISLPTRSHPSTLQVEEELANLKKWESSTSLCILDAETISSGLTSLERLYTCVDDLLSLPLTQQALSHNQHEKIVNELLDRSMRLLDICGSFRDLFSLVKVNVRDVQSALRRKKSDFIIDVSFFKKLKKDAKRGLTDLKQVDHIYTSKPLNVDPHLSLVIKVLRDVGQVSISVFGLLLSFLSVSITKPKSATKWSIMVSRYIQKGAARSNPSCVEALDCKIEGIENGLEWMFRCGIYSIYVTDIEDTFIHMLIIRSDSPSYLSNRYE